MSHMVCKLCSAEKQTSRLPRGWHRDRQREPVCAPCWKDRYSLRAITMVIARPVGMTWAELRPILKSAWVEQTAMTNWMVDELYARDVRRGEQPKMPPLPSIYLYPEARLRFPEVSSGQVATTEQAVKQKWAKLRYKVLWINSEHLPRSKYPTPLPIRAQDWSLAITADDRRDIVVSLPLRGQRIALRLKAGWRYRRQRKMIEAVAAGHGQWCEASILRRRAGGSDRSGKAGQQSSRQLMQRNGPQRAPYETALKLVAWVPRAKHGAGVGTLVVKTDPHSLIVALDAKDERLWIEHADHVRRIKHVHLAHLTQLHRLADDQKAEQRPVASFESRRRAMVIRHRRRMHGWLHEIARHLVRFAGRRRFAALSYDDSDQRFAGQFPYADLRGLIAEKCEQQRVFFRHVNASDSVQEIPQESLEG